MRFLSLLFLAACGAPVDALHIEPVAPTSAHDLHAVVDGADAPELAWLRNGARTSFTGALLPASATARGEVWTVRPARRRTPAAQVTIGNAPPLIVLEPPTAPVPSNLSLELPARVSDADGDPLEVTWRWSGPDGEEVEADGPTLPRGRLTRGDTWQLEVRASDGRDTSTATASVTVGNGAPTLRNLRLRPRHASAADAVRVAFDVADADDDPVEVEVTWWIDAQEVQRGADTELHHLLVRGQSVVVQVAADDGTDVTTGQADLIVENAPPSVGGVRVDPPDADATSVLTCMADAPFDADGDPVTTRLVWTVDGIDLGGAPTLYDAFQRGSRVTCTVFPDDGTDLGVAVTSEPLVIGNAPPTWAGLRILPEPATRASPLRVRVDGLVDPDGDALSARLQWRVDGVDAGTGRSLDPDAFERGDVVEVEVAAHDGTTWGAEAVTSVVVEDAPPTVVQAQLDRPVVGPGDALEASAILADPDGDLPAAAWRWRMDGVVLPTTGSRLVLPDGAPPDARVAAEVQASSGALLSAWVPTEPAIVVASEAERRLARISPSRPHQRDDLVCGGWGGPSGPTLTWDVGGSPVASSELRTTTTLHDTVPWQRTTAGERWRCTATWGDGPVRTAEVTIGQGPPGGNVLVILSDDLGVDKVARYGLHPDTPPTPTLEALADEGVLFRNAFAYPSCSPTRAALLTGRYGRSTGIGRTVVATRDAFALSPLELGLAEVLRYSTAYAYTSSAVGKWHIGSYLLPNGLEHPRDLGFDWFAVAMGNPGGGVLDDGGVTTDYFYWEKNTNGELSLSATYMTTDQVDDALDRIAAMPQPWLLYLAFNAPHEPMHVPPDHLHTSDVGDHGSPRRKYDAMVEAMDTEIGRLLDGIDPAVREDTTVIFLGDNGTPGQATSSPFLPGRAKTTLFEGGVHVPMIVTGPHVRHPGSEVDALVHVVDVLPTVAEIAGAPLDELYGGSTGTGELVPWPVHGESLLPFLDDPGRPGRDVVFTEKFAPNGGTSPWPFGGVAVRDARWRYILDEHGESLHDLAAQDFVHDGPNLLDTPPLGADAADAYARLTRRLDEVLTDIDGSP